MTATPIPRTLQLTVYGDLDVSVIDTLPPGRQPVATRVVDPRQRDDAYDLINQQLDAGRQAFVVCPLVEDSDQLGAKSVTAEAERLAAGPFAHHRIGLMHGRLPAAEKAAVMNQFAAGELDILVATSVIEVGIDIPNATVMMVDGAERFGLAALHQLRGRIGRGAHASHCLLVTESRAPATLERLRALESTTDGFKLAQIDLELRGPGQIYGRLQHGALDLRLADITDAKLLAAARNSAQAFLSDPDLVLKYPQIMARVSALKAVTSLD
jgi:ATP-dependent DNA helicase RecG